MHWPDATATLLYTLLQRARIGLISDIDGTLSPIVDRPEAATVTPRARALLDALRAHLTLIAAISGRAATDAARMIDLPDVVIVGNHGLEVWQNGHITIAPEAAAYRPALEAAADALRAQQVPGMQLEDKIATLSLHYRRTADPAATAERFAPLLDDLAAAHGLRVFKGRMVFELRPPVDIDKGTAFERLVREHTLDAALYLGDDTTDLDALRAARRLRAAGTCWALGVGVESEHMPPALPASADLLVSGVQDVEALLSWLLSALSASSTC